MIVNLVWDAAALAAPQSFRDALVRAANIVDVTFTDPITVNIEVGYGDLTQNGQFQQPVRNGLSLGGPDDGNPFGYAALRSQLLQSVDPDVTGALDALPSGAFSGQTGLVVWRAQEKLLGLIPAADPAPDGAVGFSTDISTSVLTGVALHELTHALGRTTDDNTDATIFDLYRFTSPGQNLIGHGAAAPPAYFSLNGGVTDLTNYGQNSDPSDFLGDTAQTGSDVFAETYNGAVLQNFSTLDLQQMQALGFHVDMAVPGQGFDFLNNGHPAIAFRNPASGDWGVMTPTAGGGEAWTPAGPTSTNYGVIAVGDFNGDGAVDVAFRNTATGDWGYMTDTGGGEAWHSVGPTSNAYAPVEVGAFSGDGRTDIVFRNVSSGDMGYMEASAGGGETWRPIGPTSTDYQAVGAADFNNDGQLDIAFRNLSTNDWGFMTVNAGGGETWHELGLVSTTYLYTNPGKPVPAVLGYDVIGAGRFDGGAYPEIAVRSPSTGELLFFTLNSNGPSGPVTVDVGPTSTAYVPVAIADFNGDGRSDVAFRNVDTGDLGYMSVNLGGGETWHPMGPTGTAYFAL
jgi:hypothetical protein